jgi:hypothetical protein
VTGRRLWRDQDAWVGLAVDRAPAPEFHKDGNSRWEEIPMETTTIGGVHSTVSNCEYWADGNRGHAGQILVTHSSPTLSADNHGKDADRLRQTPVGGVEETCCYTFEPALEQQVKRAA